VVAVDPSAVSVYTVATIKLAQSTRPDGMKVGFALCGSFAADGSIATIL